MHDLMSEEQILGRYQIDRVEVKITESFGTHDCSPYAKKENMCGIWDDKFTGVRYVKLHQYWFSDKWDQPTLHLEKRDSSRPNN